MKTIEETGIGVGAPVILIFAPSIDLVPEELPVRLPVPDIPTGKTILVSFARLLVANHFMELSLDPPRYLSLNAIITLELSPLASYDQSL
jgi:hypothetical protein